MSIDNKIIQEKSENDPLENGSWKEDEKIVQNGLENAEKITENERNALGIGSEDDLEDFEEEAENAPEDTSEDDWEDWGEEEGEEPENDWETPEIETETAEGDPLDVDAEDEPIYVEAEEFVDEIGLEKELKELLEDCGEMIIESLDEAKVSLCMALGGGHPSQYASKPKLRKKLYESIVLVMRHKDFALPTPGQTVLGILAMMTLPPVGLALINKYTGRKKDTAPTYREEASQEDVNKIDYSQTKEYKSGRTRFTVHATTGCYQYDNGKKYIEVKYANVQPSAEIQKLLDEGKTSAQIKDIVYGGKK